MEHLPIELKYQFVLKTGYPGLVSLCQTNQEFAEICRDQRLWRELYQRDFGKVVGLGTIIDWRKYYLEKYNSIDRFLTRAIQYHLAIHSKYANLPLIRQNLTQVIRDFIQQHHQKGYTYIDFLELRSDIEDILAGGIGELSLNYIDSLQVTIGEVLESLDLEQIEEEEY